MGLFATNCLQCKKPFLWWSGNPIQVCSAPACSNCNELKLISKDYVLILYIADLKMNSAMKSFDMCPDYKVFVSAHKTTITTSSQVDVAYLEKIIENSLERVNELGFWIPAIIFEEKLFAHKDIKILSNGDQELFIPQEKNEQ